MEVLNLATAALFDSLARNKIDRHFLLEGTSLKLDDVLDVKKKHSWQEFVVMYGNVARLLGEKKAAKEIAYHGLYSEKLSTLRKITTGLLDVKSIYWFLGTVASRHLFKDTVRFKYTKIKFDRVCIEVSIPDHLENCPLLLETYIYLYENVPTLLGLPKAKVSAEISGKKALYTCQLVNTSYLSYFFAKLTRSLNGYTSAVLMMEEFETQSLQLSNLLNEKSELLRIMSHDISNSAALIDMSLKKVLKKDYLHEDDKKTLATAKRSSERLCQILRSVQKLEVAHLKGVCLEAVDIDQVFSSVLEKFRENLELKSIRLVLQNNLPATVKASAERSSLEESVLSNLISNAIKFSNSGSVIRLEADIEAENVVIYVSDEGRGMSAEDQAKILSRKLRHSTIGTSGEVGTGFGLGIVCTYVQLYGGKISVEGNYPKGTIFKIYLPLIQEIYNQPS